jgi:hypothetical protein
MKIGDLVFTQLKNRWYLNCAAEILDIVGENAYCVVFNVGGPGADWTGWIPLNKLIAAGCPETLENL